MGCTGEGTDRCPRGLLACPNEVLIEIASHMLVSDLRIFGKSNVRARLFVTDYLERDRYATSIFKLPPAAIVKISQHLGSQKDRSRFAQVSHRFYKIIMNDICIHGALHRETQTVHSAARLGMTNMVRKILQAGADINCRQDAPRQRNLSGREVFNGVWTPLVQAAAHGQKNTVELLLENGASETIRSRWVALGEAISAGHEAVALLLLKRAGPNNLPAFPRSGTILELASERKMFEVVKRLLPRTLKLGDNTMIDSIARVRNLSISLVRALLAKFEARFLAQDTEEEDTYQIVLWLLKRGANPDVRMSIDTSDHIMLRPRGINVVLSARTLASRHRDPRIRKLLPIDDQNPLSGLENGCDRLTQHMIQNIGRKAIWWVNEGQKVHTEFHHVLMAKINEEDLYQDFNEDAVAKGLLPLQMPAEYRTATEFMEHLQNDRLRPRRNVLDEANQGKDEDEDMDDKDDEDDEDEDEDENENENENEGKDKDKDKDKEGDSDSDSEYERSAWKRPRFSFWTHEQGTSSFAHGNASIPWALTPSSQNDATNVLNVLSRVSSALDTQENPKKRKFKV